MTVFSVALISSLAYIAIAIGIAVFTAVIYYFISLILNDPSMQARAKEAVSGSVETALLFGGIAFAIPLLNGIVLDLIGISHLPVSLMDAHIFLADISIQDFLSNVTNAYLDLFFLEGFLNMLFSMNIVFPLPSATGVMGTVLQPLAGVQILYNFIGWLVNKFLLVIGLVVVRDYLIKIAPLLFSGMLPIAVLLRGFPSTKSLGSALFALVIAVYYVYPLSVLFTDYLFSDVYKPFISIPDPVNLRLPSDLGWSSTQYKKLADSYVDFIFNSNNLQKMYQSGASQYPSDYVKTRSFWNTAGGVTFEELIKKPLTHSVGSSLVSLSSIGIMGMNYALLLANEPTSRGAGTVKPLSSKIMLAAILLNLIYMFVFGPQVAKTMFDASMAGMLVLGYDVIAVFVSLVLEITFTVEAYKALATALGGEPLLFGLQKVI